MLASTVAQSPLRSHPFTIDHPAFPPAAASPRPQIVSFFQAGAEIYAAGDPAGNLYRVEFGAVRVYRLLADGRRQIIAFHLAGETFGFEAGVEREFFAEAINAIGICRRPLSTIDGVDPDILSLALQSLRTTQRYLLVLARHSAFERVASFLAEMVERQGDLEHVHLPMSRMDIADHLGLTIETVSRTFTRLKEQRLIELVDSRDIRILRRRALLEIGA
ncbi:helix-turn-helix domain-containing protein [Aurantimonas sp. E1-2-R+4]|uniref:helix-turn-helix domain-containing protein n=1 Tax=Aurantimonas sp. E1-2-R+4 TaxID=3113714 RepID=UPI002F939D44